MDFDLTAVWMQLQESVMAFIAQLPAFLLALVVLILFFWLSSHVAQWGKSLISKRGHSPNAATVVALVLRWAAVILGILVALSIALPTFKASDLIEVLGIGSVAIGFAFRDIFQNFLAGLIILLTDAFKIGDQIVIESEELEGTVTDIQTRATTIITYEDRRIIIPNATLFTNAVTINTATEKLRSEQVVGISYASDLDTACDLLQTAISQIDGVLPDPAPDVLVEEFADSSVNLKARWWTDARRNNVIRIKSAVVRQMKYTLDENGIEIPFPIRTLVINQP